MKLVFFAAGVVVLGIVAWNLASKKKKTHLNARRAEIVADQCRKVKPDETIFVNLACLGDVDQTAETLLSLFAQAYCPYRVFVGIYQNSDPGQRHCIQKYQTMAASTGAQTFTNQIRVLTEPMSYARGASHARFMCETQLFRDEQYYLTVHQNTRFYQNWDCTMIADYKRCLLQSPRPILTGPVPFQQAWKSRSPASDGKQLTPTRFLRFTGRWNGFAPEMRSVRCARAPMRAIPTPLWDSRFSFTSSAVLTDAKVYHDAFLHQLPRAFVDFLMSLRYWCHGYDFFIPPFPHVWRCTHTVSASDADDINPSPDVNLTSIVSGTCAERIRAVLEPSPPDQPSPFHGQVRKLDDFPTRLGIDWNRKYIQPWVRMGLSQDPPAEEVLAKYGSWTQFYDQYAAENAQLAENVQPTQE